MELASDNRDFGSCLARAKLAEMTGKAKIVPIVPPQPPPAPIVTKLTIPNGNDSQQSMPSHQPSQLMEHANGMYMFTKPTLQKIILRLF